MALLVWAPLPLASNRVWAVGVLAMAFSALLLLVCVNDYLRGHDALSRLKRAWLPILVLVLFLGLLLLQRLDLRPGVAGFTSVDPHHTLLYALMTATYLCAFVLVLLLVNTGSRIRTLAMVLVLSGVLQAIVSTLMHAGRVKYSLFFFEIDHSAYAIGTFSYRNSLANYLMICISVGIGLLVAKMGAPGSRVTSWKEFTRGALKFMLSPAMLLRLMLLVMVIALVLTRSRGGNASLLLALVLIGVPLLFFTGRLRRNGLWIVASILAIDVLVVGNLVGIEQVANRLNETPLMEAQQGQGFSQESMQTRSEPAAQAMAMVAERPWLGFGGGTFYTTFPRFNTEGLTGYYDHAHNDYMQIATETGLLGLALLATLVIATLARAFEVVRRPYSATDSGLALGVILATGAVLLQAVADFHFQIPANALTFVVVLSLAWSLRRAHH